MIKIACIDHLVLTVSSMEATCDFYCNVLRMEREIFGDNRIALKFGRQKINLHQKENEFEPKANLPTPGSADLCLITNSTVEQSVAHLAAKNIKIEQGPISRTGAQGPITSIYCRDPDGNLIEIGHYECWSGFEH